MMNSGMHARDIAARCCLKPTKLVKPLVVLFVCLLILYSVFKIPDFSYHLFTNHHPKQEELQEINNNKKPHDDDDDDDEQLEGRGGLVAAGFDEISCVSRYQSNLYRRTQPREPSSHLISKLRKYEALHRRCGPNTDSYNQTLKDYYLLTKDEDINGTNQEEDEDEDNNNSACRYVIWTPIEGLGNRMLTLAATFLYALLTNRVLLLGESGNMPDLFCEPFDPEVSWLLPSDFPIIPQFNTFNMFSPHRYGNMNHSSLPPPFVYIHLVHDYDENDRRFFCDEDQNTQLLQHVPWLILKSDLYFVPSLFSIPSFQQELSNLFPEKETVFHHLGRYLFHPTNSVWGLITRYYETYLAKADEKLGLQIRVFQNDARSGPVVKHILDQILACTTKQKLLPEINKTAIDIEIEPPEKQIQRKLLAVLITSLRPGYYEEIRNMYWQYATITGENIAVHQPSHEEVQQSGNEMHDKKALAEIYLLSMSDKLVTSGQSTFGYVAQSLGGLHPWILNKLHDQEPGRKLPPSCQLSTSMEPCFHFAPPFYSCQNNNGIPSDRILRYVRHCEDVNHGLKLF